MPQKYKTSSGSLEQATKGNPALKQLLQEMLNWQSNFTDISGIDPKVPAGVQGSESLTPPGIVDGLEVIGASGKFAIKVTPPSSAIGVLYYLLQSSETLPFESSTTVTEYGPTPNTSFDITADDSTLYWRVRCKFTNSGFGSWFITSSVNSGSIDLPLHHATHENGGVDEINVVGLSGLLADGQTPLAHKASHQSGGSDAIPLDTLAPTTDVTTLNSTTSAHGLLRKLDNNANHFLDGQGGWTTPSGVFPSAHHTTHESGGSDSIKLDDLAAPDDNTDLNASTSAHGLLRKLDNNASNFLNGQGGWSAPAFGAFTLEAACTSVLDLDSGSSIGTYYDIPGASVSLNKDGVWLVLGSFDASPYSGVGNAYGGLDFNGSLQTAQATLQNGTDSGLVIRDNTSQSWIVTVSGQPKTAKLVGARTSSGFVLFFDVNTTIRAIWLGV